MSHVTKEQLIMELKATAKKLRQIARQMKPYPEFNIKECSDAEFIRHVAQGITKIASDADNEVKG